MNIQKLIIVCGPTATGKTETGIKLAKKFNGEIISADARQVYKGMNIGTGKDIPLNSKFTFRKKTCSKQANQSSKIQFKNKKFTIGHYLVNNIPVWGLDLVEPDYQFNLGEYKTIAQQIIKDIRQRGKLPIVVGGTGLYIKALLEPMEFVSIPPDLKLRKALTYKSIKVLQKKLLELNENKLEQMNNSDKNNPRRLIRAIEIAAYLKEHPEFYYDTSSYHSKKINNLCIGLTVSPKVLFKKIEERIKKRLEQGMIKEIEGLLAKGYDWPLTSMSGLGYQEFKPFFEKKESLSEVVKKWQTDEQNYAKRQMVWFKKMPVIWFDISQPGFYTEIENRLCKFLLKP